MKIVDILSWLQCVNVTVNNSCHSTCNYQDADMQGFPMYALAIMFQLLAEEKPYIAHYKPTVSESANWLG